MPTTDLSHPGRWLESQRRSRARRIQALRRRRRGRWQKSTVTAVLVSLTVASGGAFAQSTGGSSSTAAGASVARIQGALGIPADGVLGPQTRRAIKRFQRAHGLTVDGIVGPVTLAALGLSGTPQTRTMSATTSAPATTDVSAELAKIAQCESGGNPAAISAGGTYRGKYQFTRTTWRAMGGTGDPAQADEATQDAMAAKLYAQRGAAPWPVCG